MFYLPRFDAGSSGPTQWPATPDRNESFRAKAEGGQAEEKQEDGHKNQRPKVVSKFGKFAGPLAKNGQFCVSIGVALLRALGALVVTLSDRPHSSPHLGNVLDMTLNCPGCDGFAHVGGPDYKHEQ